MLTTEQLSELARLDAAWAHAAAAWDKVRCRDHDYATKANDLEQAHAECWAARRAYNKAWLAAHAPDFHVRTLAGA